MQSAEIIIDNPMDIDKDSIFMDDPMDVNESFEVCGLMDINPPILGVSVRVVVSGHTPCGQDVHTAVLILNYIYKKRGFVEQKGFGVLKDVTVCL
ncbi:unnamed protein product [Rhizopus stolonifer]